MKFANGVYVTVPPALTTAVPLAGADSEPGTTVSDWLAFVRRPGAVVRADVLSVGVSSAVVQTSSCATGGSLTGATVTVTVAVSQSGGAPLSHTW